MDIKDYIQIVCPQCKALLFAEKRLENWYCGHCGEKIALVKEATEEEAPQVVAPVLTGDIFLCDKETLVKYAGKDEDVDIPEYITRVASGAFKGNTHIKTVHFHDGVTEIADSVFEGCTSLMSVTLPNTIRKICYKTFNDCDALRSIKIPASVEEIQYNAMCCGLDEIIFENSETTWEPVNEYTAPSFEISKSGTGAGVKKLFFKENIYQASEVYRFKSLSAYFKSLGLCTKCGGKFGMFSKCKGCGEKKDY